jgi:hypothetical protein
MVNLRTTYGGYVARGPADRIQHDTHACRARNLA